MIVIRTNDISEKQLAQIALEIQNRWNVPTFVKMHEIMVAEDDLDPNQSSELFKDFENGLSIIFENLYITAVFRLRRTGKLKYEIQRIPGSELPTWMVEIEQAPKVPEGVFECMHCVLPDTLILGDNKPISDYSQGDLVIGQTGVNQVVQKFARLYEGDLITVKANGLLPVTTTPEHPILAWTSNTTQTHRSGSFRYLRRVSQESWISAKDLVTKNSKSDGNYLVVPIVRGEFESCEIPLCPFIIAHKPNHKGYRSTFPLTTETAWLLGLYTAEGSVVKSDVRFSLSTEEAEISDRIASISRDLGYTSRLVRLNLANSVLVSIPSRVLARAFDNWCGHRASNKRIPDFLLCHKDTRLVASFLRGYEAGEGYTFAKRSGRNPGYVACSTVSRILAQQLQLSYARLGIWANVGIRDRSREAFIMGRRVRLHTKYSVTYSPEPNPKRRRVVFLSNKVLTPIREITRSKYSGVVHNLATLDNTYLVSNAVVHNCGRRFPSDIQLSMHTKLHYIT